MEIFIGIKRRNCFLVMVLRSGYVSACLDLDIGCLYNVAGLQCLRNTQRYSREYSNVLHQLKDEVFPRHFFPSFETLAYIGQSRLPRAYVYSAFFF